MRKMPYESATMCLSISIRMIGEHLRLVQEPVELFTERILGAKDKKGYALKWRVNALLLVIDGLWL